MPAGSSGELTKHYSMFGLDTRIDIVVIMAIIRHNKSIISKKYHEETKR
jgi:hypothetical protein